MILQIHDNLLVSDIQERFSKCFQFLKIEFYSKPYKDEFSEKYRIAPNKKIGEIRNNCNEGCLEIKSWYTVYTVEKYFAELFGLNIQIFRMENNRWNQTYTTKNYTLMQQNNTAFYAKFNSISNRSDVYDYYLL